MKRPRRGFDVFRMRRELADQLLRTAAGYYPGTAGRSLVQGYDVGPAYDVDFTFDELAAKPRKWLRGLAQAIGRLPGVDPAWWERDALHLLAGDPVDVPSWALPKWSYDVLGIAPAPIRYFRITANRIEEAG